MTAALVDPNPSPPLRWLVRCLGVAVVTMIALHVIGQLAHWLGGVTRESGWIAMFDLDAEKNAAAAFSALLLLADSAVSLLLGLFCLMVWRPNRIRWVILSGIFAFLALDEYFTLHERLSEPLRNSLQLSGALHFAWVLPYAVLALLFGFFAIGFLLRLPLGTRLRVIAAGTLYVSGALGLELVGGSWYERHGYEDPVYTLLTSCEETLELAGSWLFLHTVVSYRYQEFPSFAEMSTDFGQRLRRWRSIWRQPPANTRTDR